MRGLPQQLKTRADHDRAHAMAVAGECTCEAAISHFKGLLASRHRWDFDRVLSEGEQPDGPEPEYRVLESEDESTGDPVRTQFKRVERTDSRLTRLGYTAAEAESIIDNLEAING